MNERHEGTLERKALYMLCHQKQVKSQNNENNERQAENKKLRVSQHTK